MNWTLYMVTCETPGYFYIGVTADLKHRFRSHRLGKGAAFTRKHGAKSVEVLGTFDDELAAKEAEKAFVLEHRPLLGHVFGGAAYTQTYRWVAGPDGKSTKGR